MIMMLQDALLFGLEVESHIQEVAYADIFQFVVVVVIRLTLTIVALVHLTIVDVVVVLLMLVDVVVVEVVDQDVPVDMVYVEEGELLETMLLMMNSNGMMIHAHIVNLHLAAPQVLTPNQMTLPVPWTY